MQGGAKNTTQLYETFNYCILFSHKEPNIFHKPNEKKESLHEMLILQNIHVTL